MSENSLRQAQNILERMVTQKMYEEMDQCRFQENFSCPDCDPLLNYQDFVCEDCKENVETNGIDEDSMYNILCRENENNCLKNAENAVSDYTPCSDCVECTDYEREEEDFLSAEAAVKIKILFSTGGPAIRLIFDYDVSTDSFDNVELQHQDWFENWETLEPKDYKEENVLDDYVRNLIDRGVPDYLVHEIGGFSR